MAFTKSGEEVFLNRLTEITEENLSNEQFGVSELAREMGMSRSNLHRKVKSATKTSVSQFIRQVRLKKAMELLKQTSSTTSEVAFECGFHSVTYFTKCFHDHYGFPPGKAGNSEAEKHNLGGVQHHGTKPGIGKKQVTILILSSALFVIVAVFVLFFIFRPFNAKNQFFDKSIAVLPFKYLSDEPDKQYLADGTMEAILLHLSKIEDLRVLARTSVEQYRETDKTASEICQELDVAYVLEGSFQKYGDQVRLIVQLIQPGREGHAWGKEYDRNWKEIFTVQSEVARLVARELQAVITPEEKQLIEKIPTANLTAYTSFQRGSEEYMKYYIDHNNKQARERAIDFILMALEYDSTYAQAYAALAYTRLHKYSWEHDHSEYVLDSVLILADIALSYDDQLDLAYTARGWYYYFSGNTDHAIEEFDKAIKFNPNDEMAYQGKAWAYWSNDIVKAIDNYQKASILTRGPGLAMSLNQLGLFCNQVGFTIKYQHYLQEVLKLDSDSAAYYYGLARSEFSDHNYRKAIENGKKGYAIDTLHSGILDMLGRSYLFYGQFEESLKYFEKYIERKEALGQSLDNTCSIGYSYWQNGNKKEAEYYFIKQIEYSEEFIKLNQLSSLKEAYYKLAAVYAFRGEKDKAYENLRIFNQKQRMGFWRETMIKDDPLFDSIRDEPEFQQIVKDVEVKYQAEHERVRKWLEENDML